MTGHRVLERVTRNTPLGVRFWDTAEATSAVEGLRVEVYPAANPRARTVAHPNRSGVYVAQTISAFTGQGSPPGAGLRDWEGMEAEPDALWAQAPRPYRVEVTDPRGRFVPFVFDAGLPARGLFAWAAPWLSSPPPAALPATGSPPGVLEPIPLFSSPSRPVPGTLAVVRAQLREQGAPGPAAWALLGVRIDGEARGLGLADAEGRVAVMFPYPEPPRMTLASPPDARNDFAWPVELTAYVPTASPPGPVGAAADLAQAIAALAAPRAVIESLGSPPAPPLRLTYRQELTARTAGAAGADAGTLWIS